jgi:hypothetical protein
VFDLETSPATDTMKKAAKPSYGAAEQSNLERVLSIAKLVGSLTNPPLKRHCCCMASRKTTTNIQGLPCNLLRLSLQMKEIVSHILHPLLANTLPRKHVQSFGGLSFGLQFGTFLALPS